MDQYENESSHNVESGTENSDLGKRQRESPLSSPRTRTSRAEAFGESPPRSSEDERVAKELRDSEFLARRLIEEEALVSYQLSLDALRNIDEAEDLSAQDMIAIRLAMGEDIDMSYESEDDDDESDYDDESLDYDQLLDLESEIGDVKQERWRIRAPEFISKLPKFLQTSLQPGGRITDEKCLVCMHEYESTDMLMELPCKHAYHATCIQTWISSTDNCPLCKKSIITESPINRKNPPQI